QPTNTAIAIPAAGGMTMARRPATIISTLSPMDPPNDFFTIVATAVDVALITFPPTALPGPYDSSLSPDPPFDAAPVATVYLAALVRNDTLSPLLPLPAAIQVCT